MLFYRQLLKENRRAVLRWACLCMALSAVLTAALCAPRARAEGAAAGTVGEALLQNASSQLLGSFSAEVSAASSPLVAMTAMSVIGAVQNGALPVGALLEEAPQLQRLAQAGAEGSRRLVDLSGLPIATFPAAVTLLSVLGLWALVSLAEQIGELCCPPLLAVARPVSNYFSNQLGNLAGYTLVLLFTVINLVDFFLRAPSVSTAALPAACAGPTPLLMGLWRPLAIVVVFSVSFLALALGLSVYTVVKTVRRFVQIITLPVPLGNFWFALVKGSLAAAVLYFSQTDPAIGLLIGAAVLLLCGALYKTAYLAVRYYDHLYVRTAWHSIQRFFRRDKIQPPVFRRLPKQLREQLGEGELMIPAFALFRFHGIPKRMRCFLVLKDGGLYLWGKNWLRKPVCVDILRDCGGKGIFLKKEKGRYRLQWNSEGANRANLGGFALSLDYAPYASWLFGLGVVDYDSVIRQIKEAEKELHRENKARLRRERQLAKREKRRRKEQERANRPQ
ncbi:MAG: hypothetical protein SOX72_09540 [Oscillospiraceae bacterium]|nr:hypothetical protein [Oscillospiraceae bacterium]